jgi:hypothetical protein
VLFISDLREQIQVVNKSILSNTSLPYEIVDFFISGLMLNGTVIVVAAVEISQACLIRNCTSAM